MGFKSLNTAQQKINELREASIEKQVNKWNIKTKYKWPNKALKGVRYYQMT